MTTIDAVYLTFIHYYFPPKTIHALHTLLNGKSCKSYKKTEFIIFSGEKFTPQSLRLCLMMSLCTLWHHESDDCHATQLKNVSVENTDNWSLYVRACTWPKVVVMVKNHLILDKMRLFRARCKRCPALMNDTDYCKPNFWEELWIVVKLQALDVTISNKYLKICIVK